MDVGYGKESLYYKSMTGGFLIKVFVCQNAISRFLRKLSECDPPIRGVMFDVKPVGVDALVLFIVSYQV